jgi:hypothetical protein
MIPANEARERTESEQRTQNGPCLLGRSGAVRPKTDGQRAKATGRAEKPAKEETKPGSRRRRERERGGAAHLGGSQSSTGRKEGRKEGRETVSSSSARRSGYRLDRLGRAGRWAREELALHCTMWSRGGIASLTAWRDQKAG